MESVLAEKMYKLINHDMGQFNDDNANLHSPRNILEKEPVPFALPVRCGCYALFPFWCLKHYSGTWRNIRAVQAFEIKIMNRGNIDKT